MEILCQYQKDIDLFVHRELSKEEYEKLSDLFLNFSKWYRKNYLKLAPKKRKELRLKIKEMANCLLVNTTRFKDNPLIKQGRIDLIKRSS